MSAEETPKIGRHKNSVLVRNALDARRLKEMP
jgi:hypothetical protein